MSKIEISNLIGGTIFLALGIWLLVWGISYSSQFGPMIKKEKKILRS